MGINVDDIKMIALFRDPAKDFGQDYNHPT